MTAPAPRCMAGAGGEHAWGKHGRDMVQTCECGASQLIEAHKATWKRVPPQFGGANNLEMCSACGYVRQNGSTPGPTDLKIHTLT